MSNRPDNTPKASQTWMSADGASYEVVSVRKEWATGRNARQQYVVTAVTFSDIVLIDGEGSNGKLGGKKCHWAKMEVGKFAENFRQSGDDTPFAVVEQPQRQQWYTVDGVMALATSEDEARQMVLNQ